MRRLLRAVTPLLVPALGLSLAAAGAGGAHAAGGTSGPKLTVTAHQSFSGYDTLTAPDGTTYVGWISSSATNPAGRAVHLCVLRQGARSCAGGVQTADALSSSSSSGLRVVDAGGTVELVWIAQVGADSGEFSGDFGVAKVIGGTLGSSTAVPGAPTLGVLTSVIVTRSGAVSAAAVGEGTHDDDAYYYATLSSTPRTLHRPYFIGNAQLADNGHQTVLTTSEYGSLSGKVSVTSKPSGSSSWKAFSTVTGSYTLGNLEQLRTAGRHIMLVGASTHQLYTPYTWRWNGHSFGKPRTNGDHGELASLDLTSDASGRLASVATEDSRLAVSNYGTGRRASVFRLGIGSQTFAGGPAQLSTAPSGRGWLVYSVQTDTTVGDFLFAQPVHLGALTRTVHRHGRAGSLALTGPVSCLPMTSVHVAVKGRPAHPWKVASRSLRLGSKRVGGTLNGASLAAHHHYTLRGKVVFRDGGRHATLAASLSFTTCGRP